MMIERSWTAPKRMFWTPPWAEAKARVYRSWFAILRFALGNWCVGFGFDIDGLAIRLGPLNLGFEKDGVTDNFLDWSRTLCRLTIQKLKLELRLEIDFNIWLIGYSMANITDHGIYVGPFNLQIEYDKCYDWPDLHTLPPRLQCQCDVHAPHGQ
jgi:hypothetical protein